MLWASGKGAGQERMELFSVWKTKEMVFLKVNPDVLERSFLLFAEGTQVRFDAELPEPD